MSKNDKKKRTNKQRPEFILEEYINTKIGSLNFNLYPTSRPFFGIPD